MAYRENHIFADPGSTFGKEYDAKERARAKAAINKAKSFVVFYHNDDGSGGCVSMFRDNTDADVMKASCLHMAKTIEEKLKNL